MHRRYRIQRDEQLLRNKCPYAVIKAKKKNDSLKRSHKIQNFQISYNTMIPEIANIMKKALSEYMTFAATNRATIMR